MKKLYIAVILLSGLLACKKEEVQVYHGGDRVQFARQSPNVAYIGSEDYSFAAKGNIQVATINIPIDITGRVADFDRQVKVELIATETNAIQGTDFDFGNSLVKAGSSKGIIELLLKKTPQLEHETRTVSFRIVSSEHFGPGIEKQLKRKVTFFNFMVKPTDWDTRMLRFFGAYSKVKHEFVLYHLGIPEINFAVPGVTPDPDKYLYNGTAFAQFQNKLRSVLSDLNSGNIQPAPTDPFTYPLKDENGANIVIP